MGPLLYFRLNNNMNPPLIHVNSIIIWTQSSSQVTISLMSLISFKILASIVIWLVALVAGLLPLRTLAGHKNKLAISDFFASGVFLGIALFHLLPTAEHDYHSGLGNGGYPFGFLLCALGFALLFMLQRLRRFSHDIGIFLLLILSLHSLIAGSALGINMTMSNAVLIFFAIVAHKGAASFALATKLRRDNLTSTKTMSLIFIFSLMTPIGILAATAISSVFMTHPGNVLEASFNAFAAGTFLYIGLMHAGGEHFSGFKQVLKARHLIPLLSGMVLMAVVAIWT